MQKNLVNWAVALGFITIISIPMSTSLVLSDKTISHSEKRHLTPWLSWQSADSTKTYFSNITSYVNDHFGFRDTLISYNTKLNLALKQSPVKKVLIGSNDWLFYRTFNPLLMLSLDTESVEKAINRRARHVSYRARKLASQDIAYIYTIAPNKMTVYQEYLPKVYAWADLSGDYQLFSDSLTPEKNHYFVDLKTYLLSQKEKHSDHFLYYKNDTHWNPLGAYIAAQGLFQQIADSYPKILLAPQLHKFESTMITGGDLAQFVGLNDELMHKEPVTTIDACVRSKRKKFMFKIMAFSCDKNTTKVLMIGDSFRTNLYPYIAESAGTLYLASQGISHDALDEFLTKVKPDLVIEEIVQRDLSKLF